MNSRFFIILRTVLIVSVLFCGLLFMFQEKMIFFPKKLKKDYQFSFENFEEIWIEMDDGLLLHGLLFHAENPKGLIYYLKGNAGSVDSWGTVAKTYTDLNYDVLLLDYRGYGKSEGAISGEQQFLQDIQTVYVELNKKYNENEIIVLGYSIGTGAAANVAAKNNPKLLILQAPFYNMSDLMRRTYPIIPTFLLKYKFETNLYLKDYQGPIVIFHGKKDNLIHYSSSLKLQEDFKDQITLIILEGQGHNGMTDNIDYRTSIAELLQ